MEIGSLIWTPSGCTCRLSCTSLFLLKGERKKPNSCTAISPPIIKSSTRIHLIQDNPKNKPSYIIVRPPPPPELRQKMGHHSCCNQQKVKRGLWSPEEDEKLIRYITTHGYGCWSEVPEKAGHLSLSLSFSDTKFLSFSPKHENKKFCSLYI